MWYIKFSVVGGEGYVVYIDWWEYVGVMFSDWWGMWYILTGGVCGKS